jgi:transcriptional regulator with XRE-family HTH domain
MIMTTASEFKALRTNRLRLTQRQLADRIGVTSNYISLVGHSHRPVTSLLLLAIAQACGLQFSWELK